MVNSVINAAGNCYVHTCDTRMTCMYIHKRCLLQTYTMDAQCMQHPLLLCSPVVVVEELLLKCVLVHKHERCHIKLSVDEQRSDLTFVRCKALALGFSEHKSC